MARFATRSYSAVSRPVGWLVDVVDTTAHICRFVIRVEDDKSLLVAPAAIEAFVTSLVATDLVVAHTAGIPLPGTHLVLGASHKQATAW